MMLPRGNPTETPSRNSDLYSYSRPRLQQATGVSGRHSETRLSYLRGLNYRTVATWQLVSFSHWSAYGASRGKVSCGSVARQHSAIREVV